MSSTLFQSFARDGAQVYWGAYGAVSVSGTSIEGGWTTSEIAVVSVIGQVEVADSVLRCPVGFNVQGAPFLSSIRSYIPGITQSVVELQVVSLGCAPCNTFTYALESGCAAGWTSDGVANQQCQLCPPGGTCAGGVTSTSLRPALADGASESVVAGIAQPTVQYWGTATAGRSCVFVQCPTGYCPGARRPAVGALDWPSPLTLTPSADNESTVYVHASVRPSHCQWQVLDNTGSEQVHSTGPDIMLLCWL